MLCRLAFFWLDAPKKTYTQVWLGKTILLSILLSSRYLPELNLRVPRGYVGKSGCCRSLNFVSLLDKMRF
jgi:hypothetical protein